MVTQLKGADYGKMSAIKDGIENYQREAIPRLITLLKDTSFNKLQNTFDLIYPGAKEFYGHGGIVNYDIDWICVRGAWLLEEITFQNFGYRDLAITEEKLMAIHKQDYSAYMKAGSHKIDFKSKTPKENLKTYRLILDERVSKWWEDNKDSWTRLNALKDALSSNDEQRQGEALQYLRFGETKCNGLTIESYQKDIKPLIENIKNRKAGLSEQASLLLNDKESYWYKIKTEEWNK
jgi:hypothetical protein